MGPEEQRLPRDDRPGEALLIKLGFGEEPIRAHCSNADHLGA